MIFRPINKLTSLCKRKDHFPVLEHSNVVYQVSCIGCDSFYVGMTTRRLHQRLKEHKNNTSSALHKHVSETGHSMNYNEPTILAMDNNKTKLFIKESLKIKELCAYKSLNGNTGSFELYLW